MGKSGETYAFDEDGTLITESRFDYQMRSIGLIRQDQSSILTIRIVDPGGNLTKGFHPNLPRDGMPLTKMAKDATAGNSRFNIDGYRDYRGIEVLGTWLWDDKLGFGMATEIDIKEALQSFYSTRLIVCVALLFATILAITLSTLLVIIRRKSEIKLKTAYSLLEERVRVRTRDLEDARIELSVANSELQNLATIDPLTGLANRRRF